MSQILAVQAFLDTGPAPAAHTLLAAGYRYAITDIEVNAVVIIPNAAGVAPFQCSVALNFFAVLGLFHYMIPTTFSGVAAGVGVALGNSGSSKRSFPSPLYTGGTTAITVQANGFTNCTAVDYIVEISGFILPV